MRPPFQQGSGPRHRERGPSRTRGDWELLPRSQLPHCPDDPRARAVKNSPCPPRSCSAGHSYLAWVPREGPFTSCG